MTLKVTLVAVRVEEKERWQNVHFSKLYLILRDNKAPIGYCFLGSKKYLSSLPCTFFGGNEKNEEERRGTLCGTCQGVVIGEKMGDKLNMQNYRNMCK